MATIKKAQMGSMLNRIKDAPLPPLSRDQKRDRRQNLREYKKEVRQSKTMEPLSPTKKAQFGSRPISKKKAASDSVESEMFPGKMIHKSAVHKGPYITKSSSKKKMKSGGSLKAVPEDKKGSLGKLPTAVRNKMGFQKTGGKTKKAQVGCKACWGSKMKKK
jgi:hypothetical protein